MIIFKALALSKIVYLLLLTSFSKELIEEMQKMQIALIWNSSTTRIKHQA